MLVLGAIPEIQLQRLRRAAPARFALAHAATWETALATIRARPVELAVVDPLLSGTASAKEIEQLRHLFPSLPLILYTALTPPTAAVLLALGQQGVRHVVFARYDDHPGHLRHVLVAEEGRATSQQLLEQFAWALAPLPRHFLAAARVLYAHRLLQDPGFTIDDVARRLQYAQTKTLQQHAHAYLGVTAGEMRLTLAPAEALERVVRSFRTSHHAQAAAS